MRTNQVTRKQTRRRAVNRRSLLTLAAAGVGALFSLPARAHPDPVAHDTETRAFSDLKEVGAQHRVHTLRHTLGGYHVVTADGHHAEFSETNLRFSVDSSALGPHRGKPVILPAGHFGDRALVFFAAPEEISAFVKLLT